MKRTSIITAVAFFCALPSLATDIVFADKKTEALCLEHWDADGDGHLSTDEAAAVSSLGSVFRDNQQITTFEELAFFTGLTAIDDYAFYQSTLETVTFPASVTAIGEYAFSQSNLSGALHVPGTVKTIGNYAFYSCKQLTRVVLEEGVETVGWHAFSGPIASLSLPTTLTFMSSMAIDPYVNAAPSSGLFVPEGDLYVYAHAETPATINPFAFYYVFSEAHLVVPFGCTDAYQANDGWSHFGEYLELGDVNEDGTIDLHDLIAIYAAINGQAAETFNADMADTDGDGTIGEADADAVASVLMQDTSDDDATSSGLVCLSDFEMTAGETKTVSIQLDNASGNYCSALFDVSLPKGIVMHYFQPADARHSQAANGDGTTHRWLIADSGLQPLPDGELMTITLTADPLIAAGSYEGRVSHISLADARGDGSANGFNTFTITIKAPVADGIDALPSADTPSSAIPSSDAGKRYNLSGQLVNENYKGIIILNGKKIVMGTK